MATPMAIDRPLTVWYCDACDEPIERSVEAETLQGQPGKVPPEKTGVVAWVHPRIKYDQNVDEAPERSLPTAYKVLHKITCDTDRSDATWETDSLLGHEGLQRWSELLWHGPTSEPFRLAPGATLNPTLDLIFRFQIPYYEQGRRYLHTQSALEILGGRIILSDDEWQTLIKKGSREVEEGY